MKSATVYTIVVIDKDLELLNNLQTFLESKSFNVHCYSTEASALEGIHQSRSTWSILITDYNLPQLNSTKFINHIYGFFPLLTIIPLTPQNDIGIEAQMHQRGRVDQRSKRLYYDYLKEAIQNVIQFKEKSTKSTHTKNLNPSLKVQNSLIGKSQKFLDALNMAKKVSKSSANVLLTGESGTGKEVFAKYIHDQSKHRSGPFTAINCSSIPEHLLESELFGHAKGSFTGASEKRIGLFESAENGTFFLDEIGDLTLTLQAKLLRVLQEKLIKRVGENKDIPINCRVISATHKDLEEEIKEKRFREDLFYRLNVIPIRIPALRERQEDIMPLAQYFLNKFAMANDSSAFEFSPDCVDFITHNYWKGNVRELENMVERAVILSSGSKINLENCLLSEKPSLPVISNLEKKLTNEHTFSFDFSGPLPPLEDVIKKYISFAILKNGGARDKTAKDIGIDRKTLYRRMES